MCRAARVRERLTVTSAAWPYQASWPVRFSLTPFRATTQKGSGEPCSLPLPHRRAGTYTDERFQIHGVHSRRSTTAISCQWTSPLTGDGSPSASPRLRLAMLETGAGTGVVTRELARILPSEVAITATDLNEPMLAVARANIGDERIYWQQADAVDLPFPNGEFDVVVCQFSVMFFPDKPKAFRETFRVLRPGGRFLFNVWDSFSPGECRLGPDYRGSNRRSRYRSRSADVAGAALPRRPADPIGSSGGGVHWDRIGEGFRTEPRGFGPRSSDDRLPWLDAAERDQCARPKPTWGDYRQGRRGITVSVRARPN
jgi:SAM-dependent methyltransferase